MKNDSARSFELKSFYVERKARLSKNIQPLPLLFTSLDEQLLKNKIVYKPKELSRYIDKIISLNYEHPGLTPEQYLLHPFRVAKILVAYADETSFDQVKLALAHNIIEVVSNSSKLIREIVTPSIFNKIKLLTVDRSSQWDWSYKEDYYQKIKKSISMSRVKIADKLDNIFLLDQNPDVEVKRKYIYELETFVIPLTRKFLPNLEDYFTSSIQIVKKNIS